MLVRTNLNTTRQAAREIVFEPTAPITATDLQEAVEQIATQPAPPISPTNIAATPYAPVIGDTLLWVDTSTAKVIDLPTGASRAGRLLQIKDITGNANTNNITINPAGGETIDGLSPMLIDVDFAGVTLYPKPAGGWTTQP